MKSIASILAVTSVCCLAALGSSPVRAQQAAPDAAPAERVGQSAANRAVNDLPESVKPDPAVVRELEKFTVAKLALKDASPQQALTQLLEPLEIGYEFDPAFYTSSLGGQTMDLPPRSITMRLVNAPLPKALDSVARAIGIGWTAEQSGKSITVRFVKLKNTMTATDILSHYTLSANGLGTPVTVATATGVGDFGGIAGGVIYGGPVGLPATPVKLDVHDKPVRDALRTVLEQAKIDFAIDEDVPADLKRSFVFEGVRITTALTAICQSAGIGWRTEQTSSGVLVRVSKRYAAPLSGDPIARDE